eukprot:3342154-Rhodomonas_salina.1
MQLPTTWRGRVETRGEKRSMERREKGKGGEERKEKRREKREETEGRGKRGAHHRSSRERTRACILPPPHSIRILFPLALSSRGNR